MNETEERYLNWLSAEIERRGMEIEELAPRGTKGDDHQRLSDTKVGINRGLRMARNRFLEMLCQNPRDLYVETQDGEHIYLGTGDVDVLDGSAVVILEEQVARVES